MSALPVSAHARRWWTLGVLSITSLMLALDTTVINIALPSAQIDLGFSSGNRQWLITAYTLSFGSLLLLGGRLSDLWGRRVSLYVGLGGFAVASAAGGVAKSFAVLVSARAIQGVFAALLAPAALATLTTTFEGPRERARAFSYFGAVTGSGAAIGLLLGGALTQWASWRWCLFINLVFAALALVGVAVFVREGRSEHHAHLDVLGTLLGSAGLFLIVYGLSHAVTTNWSNSLTWGSLAAGTVLLVAFTRWQQRSAHPLLPLRLLLNRVRGGSLVALFITNFGVFGISLFIVYYLQSVLDYSPMRTGIDFLPMVAALAFSAFIASARLLGKVGPRPLVPTGMLLSMMGVVLFTRLSPTTDYLSSVLPGLVLTGLGLGLIVAPAVASATLGVNTTDAGAASALVNTTSQIGGSVGAALLNTIAVSATARAAGAFANQPTGYQASLAVLHGYSMAFWWIAGFFGAGAVLTFGLLESGVPGLDMDVVPIV